MLTTLFIAIIASGTANAYDGACCLDDGSCTEAVDRDCADLDGTYMGDYTTCSDDLECPVVTDEPETGACCIDDTCWQLTEEECADREGDWSGLASECDADMACPGDDTTDTGIDEELGACCVDDTCIDDMSYNDCKLDLGDWYAGTDCGALDAECEIVDPDLGACCVDLDGDGVLECVDAVSNDWCSHNFGTWYAGMDCVAVDAECEVGDPDLGACCREDTCIDNVTESECEDVGTWYYGSTCADVEAECGLVADDLGACCLKDECIEITAEECWAEQGSFYGPDSSCDDAFVECCGDDTTTEPTGPSVSLSCNSSGQNRGNLGLLLPLGLLLMLAGYRREEGASA